jgi:thioredoxin-related protein
MQLNRAWVKTCALAGAASFVVLGGQSRPCRADAPATATASAPASKPKSDAQVVQDFLAACKDKASSNFFPQFFGLNARLNSKDAGAEPLARELLKAEKEFTTEAAFLKQLDKMVEQKQVSLAAQLLLQFARAWHMAVQYADTPHVAVGQVVVEDGKLDPVLVMAQMQILDEGYFAGELGDLKRPLSFRAHGYENVDLSLEGKEGAVIFLPPVRLTPVSKDQCASLKGKIEADGAPDMKSVTARMSISVPTPNTPRNYYSPRPRWPEPITIPVSENGEFALDGLSPTTYSVTIACDGHANFSKPVTFTAGQAMDLGTCHLLSTDVGFYAGGKAPETKELAWEKDLDTALKKAQEQKKPLLIMSTATWCGPCKTLESKTLDDPWIRYFLSPFVIVKVFEDHKLMEKYGLTGYPSLIFADSSGESMHKSIGYKPCIDFAREIAEALKALAIKTTPEMQKLIDKKVITVD